MKTYLHMYRVERSKKFWNDVVFLHNVAKTVSRTWYAFHVLFEAVVSQWHQAKCNAFKMRFQELLALILKFLQ
jgi:hypothetical protein